MAVDMRRSLEGWVVGLSVVTCTRTGSNGRFCARLGPSFFQCWARAWEDVWYAGDLSGVGIRVRERGGAGRDEEDEKVGVGADRGRVFVLVLPPPPKNSPRRSECGPLLQECVVSPRGRCFIGGSDLAATNVGFPEEPQNAEVMFVFGEQDEETLLSAMHISFLAFTGFFFIEDGSGFLRSVVFTTGNFTVGEEISPFGIETLLSSIVGLGEDFSSFPTSNMVDLAV
mmetsp:Transcript_12245/g.24434  ORF Transcript_12245/g.24434 Transcript_12245/m.24434 type:complete len:227 (-) Transcript_12245:1919-2599(-)